MEIFLQNAGESDSPVILNLMSQYYEHEGIPFDPTSARKTVRELIQNEKWGKIWLIRFGHNVVGYIVLTFSYSLEYHGQDAFIDEFYILEGFRRKGIGQKIIRMVDIECQQMGLKALHLMVNPKNIFAQNFYQKTGFQQNPHHWMTKPIANRVRV